MAQLIRVTSRDALKRLPVTILALLALTASLVLGLRTASADTSAELARSRRALSDA